MPVYTCDVFTAVGDANITASAGSVFSCVTDASDGTYAYKVITTGQVPEVLAKFKYSGATSGIPYRFRGIARVSTQDGVTRATSNKLALTGIDSGGVGCMEVWSIRTGTGFSTTPADLAGDWHAVSTEDLSKDFTFHFASNWNGSDYSGASIRVYKMSVELETTTVPSVTVTALGTVETAQPVLGWAFSDGDGWAQTRAVVKVFDAATYGAGGFNPETSIPVWSATVDGTATSTQLLSGLVNTTTYRTYVKAAKTVNGVYQYSAWANNAAWQYVAAPPDASVSAAWTMGTQAMTVTCYGSVNLLTSNQSSLETDATGWAADANCSVTRSTTYFKYGVASLRLSSTAGGSMAATTPTGTSGIPVQPNKSYTAQAYSRAGASARTVHVSLRWYNSAGTIIGTYVAGTGSANSTANFDSLRTVTATSPASAAYAAVSVHVASTGGAAELHYFDGIILAPAAGPVSWTNGGMTNIVGLLEREDPDGWRTVRGGRVSGATAAGHLVVVDYECRRGGTVNYRYTVSGTHALGFPTASAPATDSEAATSDGMWWFKVLDTPSLNAQTNVLSPLKVSIEADVGVFRPLDASAAVAVTGQVYGEDGEYRFLSENDTDYTTRIRPLMVYSGTVLVQDPLGRHKWVRWTTPRDVEETYGGGQVRRYVTLGYIEVLPDLVV